MVSKDTKDEVSPRNTWASSHECFMILGLGLRMPSKLALGQAAVS